MSFVLCFRCLSENFSAATNKHTKMVLRTVLKFAPCWVTMLVAARPMPTTFPLYVYGKSSGPTLKHCQPKINNILWCVNKCSNALSVCQSNHNSRSLPIKPKTHPTFISLKWKLCPSTKAKAIKNYGTLSLPIGFQLCLLHANNYMPFHKTCNTHSDLNRKKLALFAFVMP